MMQKMYENFQSFLWFLHQCSIYFSIQLGRCALVSFAALGVVLLLRCSVLKEKIFLKGMLWSIFLLVPFVGKLELFYSSILMRGLFLWWNNICIRYSIIGYCYLLGVVISGVLIFYQHRKLHKQISNMEQGIIGDKKVYISEAPVTSFTIGVFRPKIVIPKVMKDTFETEELQTVLLHEETHIRLGHLWFYLFWDALRMLLWPNPLLTYCMRYLKEDMEDVCDRVTIQKGCGTAYEYGRVLLKSVKLLKAENVGASATFVGEIDYQDLKHRITKVAEYKPYQTHEAVVLCMTCMLLLAGMFSLIKQISFPKYKEADFMCLINGARESFLLHDSDSLQDAVRIDGANVYIDRGKFQSILREHGIDDSIESFWLSFGSYVKMPGIGSSPNIIYVNYGEHEALTIPYDNVQIKFFEHFFINLP